MLYDTQPAVAHLVDAARSVEGVARNVSTHAAGVVVAGEPLVEHVPLQRASKSDTTLMAQYSMKPLEKIGLLKMDFLGLINLSILEDAVRFIKYTHGIDVDIANPPLDDQATYDLLLREAAAYSPELAAKPHVVVVTKADLLTPDTPHPAIHTHAGAPVVLVSAVTRAGIGELLETLWQALRAGVATK